MLISDYFVNTLIEQGIDKVYLYPGGTIAPLVTSCLKNNIKIEIFKNEQGAAYAALANARLTGRPQVVMVTSGPGVTNTISPIADAFYDSTPLVIVTGQIGSKDLISRSSVRQRGFQEVPTVQITAPISKKASCLINTEKALEEIPLAFEVAQEGRKGPVILDFPMDIQRSTFDKKSYIPSKKETINIIKENKNEIKEIFDIGINSKRPVILLGQGALNAGISEDIHRIKNKFDSIVVTSFLGISSFDTDDRDYAGYIGHTGHLAANTAVHEADFLLVLGSRLDVRQTGTLVKEFVQNGRVVLGK